jgi:peptidoglycan/LPS O-acetylase OafA/YrhL
VRSPVETVLPYRADVDGLRALAVVAVILFHAGIPGVHGGYVGVDIFFVISGYLITGWLLKRDTGSWPAVLREFYIRRGRRILPAFLFMLAVTTAIAAWLLQPAHLEIFGRFLATGAVMLANVGARFNGNYFGWTASDMPLLHLWSIAVEEQFYLFYPLVFLALTRWFPATRDRILLAAAAASFALCLWSVKFHPVANYFFLPTRAWELLMGALVALGLWPRARARWPRELIALAALAAILASAIFYTPQFAYPSWPTLIPCVATAVLISSGADGSLVTRLLSLRPLVFTGLLSYSLYLWHMPVLGLYRYFNIFALRPLELGALLVAIYLLAAFTWRWVELPFRRRQRLPDDARFWLTAAAASATLCVVGTVLVVDNSYARRLAEMADAAPRRDADLRDFPARCIAEDFANIRRGDLCSFGPTAGTPVLVWGDSHSWALAPLYRRLATERNLRIYIAQVPRCPPLLDVVADPRCEQFNRAMLAAVDVLAPRRVVLNARWGNPDLHFTPAPAQAGDTESPFSRGLRQTLRHIDAPGRAVCVVKAVPAVGFAAEYALEMARRRGIDTDFLSLTRQAAYAQDSRQDADIDLLARTGSIRAVDPKNVLCAGPRCRYLSDDGISLYRDDNHVSAAGAVLLHDEVARCFDGFDGGWVQGGSSRSATANTASGE